MDKDIITSKKGTIMLSSVLIGLILLSFASTYFLSTRIEANDTRRVNNRLACLPIAEAGIERAIWFLKTNGWTGSYDESRTLRAGQYHTTIENTDDPNTSETEITITSKATMQSINEFGANYNMHYTANAIIQTQSIPAAPGGPWNSESTPMFETRTDHTQGTMVVGGKNLIFVMGGAGWGGPDETIRYFDPSDDSLGYDSLGQPKGKWFDTKVTMKDPTGSWDNYRGALSSAVVNNKMYAIGGYGNGEDGRHQIDEYDPSVYDPITGATGTWTTKTSIPTDLTAFGITGKTGKRDATAAVVNDKIYIFGGSNNSSYPKNNGSNIADTVYAYDPATDTWQFDLARMPTPRGGAGCAVVNGKIYVIGGIKNGGRTARVEVYDPETDTWGSSDPSLPCYDPTLPELPTARNDLAVVSVNNEIYAIAGKDSSGYIAGGVKFNPATGAWESLGYDMGTARIDSGYSVTDDGKIYLTGGLDGSTDYDDVNSFPPPIPASHTAKVVHWE